VEKEFHLEISTGQGEERTGATQEDPTDGATTTVQSCMHFTVSQVCMYMGYSAGKCTYVRYSEERHIQVLRKVIVRGRTTKEELLGFAGVVYSFLYFSVGHFPVREPL
jgi:hypothetical protein